MSQRFSFLVTKTVVHKSLSVYFLSTDGLSQMDERLYCYDNERKVNNSFLMKLFSRCTYLAPLEFLVKNWYPCPLEHTKTWYREWAAVFHMAGSLNISWFMTCRAYWQTDKQTQTVHCHRPCALATTSSLGKLNSWLRSLLQSLVINIIQYRWNLRSSPRHNRTKNFGAKERVATCKEFTGL